MPILFVLLILLCAVLIFLLIKKSKNASAANKDDTAVPSLPDGENSTLPYSKKYLLTKNEWFFYKQLKKVEVKKGTDKKEWGKYFSKIKSKHLDFVLCNPDNLAVLLLIELDDTSHEQEERKERDEFVERLLNQVGYQLLRVRSDSNIEEKICELLKLEKAVK